MMAGYRRAISFPARKPTADGAFALATASDKLAAYRIRSSSLPCRFHPLLLQLDDDVAALRLVIGQHSPPCRAPPPPPSASSVSAAASQVCRVLVSLSELLHHPQAQEPLRRLGRSSSSRLAERLLDDFLRLADAHGSFRQALVALAALQAETRAALRRRGGDPARLASASRAQRRAARDLPRLAAAVRAVASRAPAPLPEGLPADTAALAAALADATVAVASGSAAVFSGLFSLSDSAASARVVEVASTPCWVTSAAPTRLAGGGSSSSDAPRTSSRHRIWWVADLVRWMSRAKRRSAEKQNGGGDEDESSTVQLRSEPRMKPEEMARKAAFERHENLERCIANVDGSGEKVFRALVNTRVSLLNILSPGF